MVEIIKLVNYLSENKEDYLTNARLVEYLSNYIDSNKNSVNHNNQNYIKQFVLSELKRIIEVIPSKSEYKEKDLILYYGDGLVHLYNQVNSSEIKDNNDISIISDFVSLVSKERFLEVTLAEIFEKNRIEKEDIEYLLSVIGRITDQYQKSLLYQGLNFNKDRINNLTIDAKRLLSDYVVKDIKNILSNDITEDSNITLEYAVDIVKYFATKDIVMLLEKVLELNINSINYFALETLLDQGIYDFKSTIKNLAEDLEYADLTYSLLKKYDKEDLFPIEYISNEYLAKSNLVRWLTYPTELNKKPIDIELIGITKVDDEDFYLFKYISDSKNLGDDLINKYLIGWYGSESGSFSNFDKFEDYEKKTMDKTIKNIVKKIIRKH